MTLRRRISYFILAMVLLTSVVFRLFQSHFNLGMNLDQILMSPNRDHWMGTDSLGRDLLFRVIQGSWVSLSVGFSASVMSLFIGLVFAVLISEMGMSLRRLDLRCLDIFLSIPQFIFISTLSVFLFSFFENHPGLFSMDSAWLSWISLWAGISFTHWAGASRLLQGFIQDEFRHSYVSAARALGACQIRIYSKHIYPNIKPRVVTLWLTLLPSCLLYEGVMSFLGFGVRPPQASLGILIHEGWRSLSTYPHLLLFPAMVLFLFVWCLSGIRR